MDRIIVGFDGSPSAAAALAWAVAEARLRHCTVTAWTIVEPHSASEGAGSAPEFLGPVKSLVDDVAAGYPVDHHIAAAAPAAALVAACTAADLLVVGSRGRNPLTGLLLGSVSRACLHAAPCPVVVVRPGQEWPRNFRRVIVGVDASPQARQALILAAEEAALRGTALHAVHAVQWDPLGAEFVAPDPAQLVSLGKRLVESELAHANVAARTVIIPGHANEVLVRHSGHADLLVLGSRGRNPLANLVLGSTSEYCAQHASCPTMIVRSG